MKALDLGREKKKSCGQHAYERILPPYSSAQKDWAGCPVNGRMKIVMLL